LITAGNLSPAESLSVSQKAGAKKIADAKVLNKLGGKCMLGKNN
jgi:hypothetical protein